MVAVIFKLCQDGRTSTEIKDNFYDSLRDDVFFLMSRNMIYLPDGLYYILKTGFFRYIKIIVQFSMQLLMVIQDARSRVGFRNIKIEPVINFRPYRIKDKFSFLHDNSNHKRSVVK